MLSVLLPILGSGGVAHPAHCRFETDAVIVLSSPEIRTRDLAAAGNCLVEMPDDAPLAVLPAGAATYAMSCAQLAHLVSRRGSGMVVSCATGREPVRFLVAAQKVSGACFRLTQSMTRGGRLGADILQSVDCGPDEARTASAAMDAAGLVAVRDMRAGDVIGPVRLPDRPLAEAGDRVRGRVAAGPVRIEREFELLQPAWPGRDVFARDEAGEVIVLSVPPAAVEGEFR